jgi:hypothetical protein
MKLCLCGRPLHYSDPEIERLVEKIISIKGELVAVRVGDRGWMVPRHYIALHGIRAQELTSVAEKYGLREIDP